MALMGSAAAEPLRLTLDEALARAGKANAALLASGTEIDTARANVERSQAWVPQNPYVSAGLLQTPQIVVCIVDQPERFARVFTLNTWLHHDGFEYGEGIRWWRQAALDPAQLGGDMPTGRIVSGSNRRAGHDAAAVTSAYDAPFPTHESKAGARRFPYCIPFGDPVAGNAADQQRCFDALPALGVPIHLAFGDADAVFTFDWAQRWHSLLPGSTLDRIEGAGHFVQEDAPDDCVDIVLRHAGTAGA